MIQFLFLFTITPVQSFISQARKTQDLYAGSYILSHLCRTGARWVEHHLKGEILFPEIHNQSIPNRFLAVLTASKEDLLRIGGEVEEVVRQEMRTISDSILNSLSLDKPADFDRQINSYFQIYWTFYPYNEPQYCQCFEQIEKLLGSVKNTKKFEQLSQESGRKCSITGEHNVQFYREKGQAYIPAGAVQVPGSLSLKYLGRKESLGAIAFVKRCADKYFTCPSSQYDKKFPSTAAIALMETENQLKKKRHDDIHISEPHMVFSLRNKQPFDDDCTPEAKVQAQNLLKLLETEKINFSSYYAVMLYDGDNMGKWLSGEYLNSQDGQREFHRSLSSQLGIFALKASREILIEPKGKAVYAGGDDFLGFINITHMLPVLKEMRNSFDRTIDLSCFSDEHLTFSAGVVIAHIKTPLSEVLAWVRKMEHEAKSIDINKNAIGLAVLKHSGEIHKTVLKWRYDERCTVTLLATVVKALQEENISESFIKSMGIEFGRIMDDDQPVIDDKLVKTEVRRLIYRSATSKKNSQWDDAKIDEFCENLYQLYLDGGRLERFLSFLSIARFLAREV
ncbi:MAG TPA: type III-B CRISPR-associated protein Cas10/Cmr2 [Methylomusa anaerophila]|uniref:CRISPR-associated protein n=1 Tax=Methylomusa anaerophila TaxID=1930071 RepID=A0A348ALW3_9FIRM|nr:type III-B CRISPR-associated protein Cas10/Cmr2 [Methylomusa anaerophila]BBB92061.1 CRISPR-associated protein [Methylomusa anaerophila]HML87927.1 type III-B CRISPR-associated protein Cas10/Cmr2 [Methylomusa anaerophila]